MYICGEEWIKLIVYNMDFLILDCLKNSKHPSHFNFEEALELIQKVKPKKAILTNLHTDLDYFKLKKNYQEILYLLLTV